jgi:DNA polymerase-3 subunit epsilon
MFYSFLDLETTGFSPRLNDRIIEIGIVKTDETGNPIDSFETLINPNRDVGATFIHGITAEMLCDAPSFDEIASDVIKILNDSIIIAHNVSFDLKFLKYELANAGYENFDFPCLCTLEMARKKLSFLPSKKLECLCNYFDIQYENKHSAMADCKATWELFIKLNNKSNISIKSAKLSTIKKNKLSKVKTITRIKYQSKAERYISPFVKIVKKLPEIESKVDGEKEYLSILDDILLDRIVTEQELDTILAFSKEFNITKDTFQKLNKKYLKNLIRVYLEDDYISDNERKDIDKIQKILLLEHLDTDKLINDVKNENSQIINCIGKNNYEGKSVCFTGQLNSKINQIPISRKKAQEIAFSKGLIVKKNVSKILDYLVLSDVHSCSGKAKKARNYGITLISENAFWSMLGVQIE